MRTVRPTDGMVITESARLAPGAYFLENGISIAADAVEVDATGVVLVGLAREASGISLAGRKGVTIKRATLRNYYHGIRAADCDGLVIDSCDISGTAELEPNTVFLDIWLPAEKSYGGGICLVDCRDSVVTNNMLQHQMNGLLTYGCSGLKVEKNQCNYNSGYGIHLYDTCDSEFIENSCDYCCRFEPREGGLHYGHMGADSTGFLIVNSSCRNRFLKNTARMGGDGFFLAGLAPDGTACGSDDNLFEENDASYSPNIAFEGTFSKGNVYRKNVASRCNYGFWCGYSREFMIEDNQIVHNRQAGIAVENGVGFEVRRNMFQSNGHGILLWSKQSEKFMESYPDRNTSRDWQIEANRFLRNGKGVRIAADQDHGIRDFDGERCPDLPHSHSITNNDIQDNRVGIELIRTRGNLIKENTINSNVEANLRQSDSEENEISNNPGMFGARL